MKGVIGIAMIFVACSFLLYMGLGMISQVPEPAVGTDEYELFSSLSNIVDISYKGFWMVLMIIAVMAVIGAIAIGKKVL